MSTHNLCFNRNMKNIRVVLSGNFRFLEVKFSIYLNRRVYVMLGNVGRKMLGLQNSFTSQYSKALNLDTLSATSNCLVRIGVPIKKTRLFKYIENFTSKKLRVFR